MPQNRTLSPLALIAEDQWGLVTRRQAEAAGVSTATMQRLSAKGSALERIARGTYHLAGAPIADHIDLRAAWLQLAPERLAWERRPDEGVVSHRSAAALFELGHLPADRHEFTVTERRQTRRADVRIHRGRLGEGEYSIFRGLPVTTPARTAADLLADREDPEAVAQVIVDALRKKKEWPGRVAVALSPRAAQLGLRRGDGFAVLARLLDLGGDPAAERWLEEARSEPVELLPAG
jgi:predicted transcriptional regulator of viral defense system